MLGQDSELLHTSGAAGVVHCCPTTAILVTGVSIIVQKQLNDHGMPCLGCQMNRGPQQLISGIHSCAFVQQELNHLDLSLARSNMKRALLAVRFHGIQDLIRLVRRLPNEFDDSADVAILNHLKEGFQASLAVAGLLCHPLEVVLAVIKSLNDFELIGRGPFLSGILSEID